MVAFTCYRRLLLLCVRVCGVYVCMCVYCTKYFYVVDVYTYALYILTLAHTHVLSSVMNEDTNQMMPKTNFGLNGGPQPKTIVPNG